MQQELTPSAQRDRPAQPSGQSRPARPSGQSGPPYHRAAMKVVARIDQPLDSPARVRAGRSATRPRRRRAAPLAPRSRRAPRRPRRRGGGGRRARRSARVPHGAHAVALLRHHAGGPRPGGATPEPLARRPHPPLRRRARRAGTGATCTPPCTRTTRPCADGLGFNTAICVAPDGALRRPHPQAPHPDHRGLPRGPLLPPRRHRLPRAWQWRAPPWASRPAGTSGSPSWRGRTRSPGAEVLVYPTAIGSEPDHPGFDTEPLWQQVIVGNGIANGTFMVAVNRIGTEAPPSGTGDPASRSTGRRSSPTPTAGCSCRRPATSPPSWWPTSTSTPAGTGWRCSRSSPPGGPTPTSPSPTEEASGLRRRVRGAGLFGPAGAGPCHVTPALREP